MVNNQQLNHPMKKISVSVVAVLCASFAASAQAAVVPVKANVLGKSYAEWSSVWWQWALSLPVDQNPFFDEGESVNGANDQLGRVWFLTGVINESGTVTRTITIPPGVMLFFPVINTEASTLEPPPFFGSNEAELRDAALSFTFANVVATVDGAPVQNLADYMVTSQMFEFSVPENNVLGVPAGSGFSVSHGIFLMLSPLSVGVHVLQFGGTSADFNYTLDITYVITVAPNLPCKCQ
jgi:hypothetical protein